MEVNNVAVMRRRHDSWLNATQILKVAGVEKGKRTKVLEKEVLNSQHEKVQGGYGKYQGTWIDYRRGREFCRQYGVEELLRPLLEYDVNGDGAGSAGQTVETPTKEQAMAANRKKFYTSSMDAGNVSQKSNGTFFSNISSTASNALAAMNKVARLNSPAPRPASAQKRLNYATGRPTHQPMGSQDSQPRGSQQSFHSVASDRSMRPNGYNEPLFASQGISVGGSQEEPQEPPRKRLRPSSQDMLNQSFVGQDMSMRDGTPTEPNESFVYQQIADTDSAYVALPPLPHPTDDATREKQEILLDLFSDLSRTDFASHPAMKHLSGADLDIPLDNSANTALHWAATLARVSLIRLLISKGATISRGNVAGQTALMSAVLVNNSLDRSCFPELLEILSPLIEIRDAQGRTILHHIAVSSGIKGRAASSKYYLEALLEFLVRSTSHPGSQPSSFDGIHSFSSKPIGLMRFMSEMVNARDKAGNTALNLVARIGNRNIIQQLLEVQADPTIPNLKGLRPIDFGVGGDAERALQPPGSQMSSPSKTKSQVSRVEETSRDMIPGMYLSITAPKIDVILSDPAMSSFLSQADSQFTAELRLKQDVIDRTNVSIRELSAVQKNQLSKLESLQRRIRAHNDRQRRISNLRRSIEETRSRLAAAGIKDLAGITRCSADLGYEINPQMLTASIGHDNPNHPASAHAHQYSPSTSIPSLRTLCARLAAYNANNKGLAARAAELKARSGELESRYRRVVSLCTGVEENRVEEMLPALVAAVESESGDGMEVARVREFLRKVEGV